MKYSYPDSLITLAAAVTQACSLHTNKNDNPVAPITCKASTGFNLNTNNHNNSDIVGIKFDNISAGKYFALLHTRNPHSVVNRAIEKSD